MSLANCLGQIAVVAEETWLGYFILASSHATLDHWHNPMTMDINIFLRMDMLPLAIKSAYWWGVSTIKVGLQSKPNLDKFSATGRTKFKLGRDSLTEA